MSLELLRAASKIAYVFSGGSSRCAFQVGVIERLGEIEVDVRAVRPSGPV